jgi:hypothetical protein
MADGDYNQPHSPSENPWIDVFGAGEKAEDAYGNTDCTHKTADFVRGDILFEK